MAAPHHTSHATLNPAPEPPPVSAAMARAHQNYWRFNLALIATLMTLGFVVSFVLPLVAPALDQVRFIGFRLPFYFGAQGAILIYVALIVVYIAADAACRPPSATRFRSGCQCWCHATPVRPPRHARGSEPMKLTNRLIRSYALYTLGFLLFIYVMWRIERTTGPGVWIGYVFLFVPIAVYAVIGLLSRTSDLVEYYVAGRRVPSAFNGMATAADWLVRRVVHRPRRVDLCDRI